MTKIVPNLRSQPVGTVSQNSVTGIDLYLAYKALIGAYIRVQRNASKVESKSVNLNPDKGSTQHEEGTL
jgi:hypothetical protein